MDILRRWTGALVSRNRLVAVFLLILSVGVYANSLPNEFVLDDLAAVTENPYAKAPLDLKGIVTTNYWGNRPGYEQLTIYRPLATLTFALTDLVAPGDCAPCHRAMNLLLHFLVTWMVFRVALALGLSRGLSFWAAIAFAVHPLHTEAVDGIVSRAELLSALWVLLALDLFLRRVRPSRWNSDGVDAKPSATGATVRSWLGIAGLFVLAVLSKENGLMLPGVLLAVHFVSVVRQRVVAGSWHISGRELLGYVPLILIAAAYLGWRAHILSGMLGGQIPPPDNPLLMGDWVARVATPLKVWWTYLGLLVAPYPLTIDYSYAHFPVLTTFWDFEVIGGLLLLVGTVLTSLALVARAGSFAGMSLAFLAVYLPGSSLLFPSTIVVAERLMYLPSAFFLLAVVGLVAEVRAETFGRYGRLILGIAAGVLCVGYAGYAVMRNTHWETPERLYREAVKVSPDSARAQALLGGEYLRQGKSDQAIPFLERSLSIWAGNPVVQTNMAAALMREDRMTEAEVYLRQALALKKKHPPALMLTTYLLMDGERFEEALPFAERWVGADPGDAHAWLLLAGSRIHTGKAREALPALAEARKLGIPAGAVASEEARALVALGRYEEGLSVLSQALQTESGFIPPMSVLCDIYDAIGEPRPARDLCARFRSQEKSKPHAARKAN